MAIFARSFFAIFSRGEWTKVRDYGNGEVWMAFVRMWLSPGLAAWKLYADKLYMIYFRYGHGTIMCNKQYRGLGKKYGKNNCQ